MTIAFQPPRPTLDFVEQLRYMIEAPKARDRQIKVGPSSLGNPCDHCLAMELNDINLTEEEIDHGSGNLATWWGNAAHFYLEHLLGFTFDPDDLLVEQSVPCGLIPGYGVIVGHVDLFHIPSGTLLDWKGSKKEKIRGYKMNGSGQTYRVQRNCYGKGVTNLGHTVNAVVNFYIPRDGWQFSEMWPEIEPFEPDLADRAIKRATTIFTDYVQTGQIDELGSDPECFQCNTFDFSSIKNVNIPKEPTNGRQEFHL